MRKETLPHSERQSIVCIACPYRTDYNVSNWHCHRFQTHTRTHQNTQCQFQLWPPTHSHTHFHRVQLVGVWCRSSYFFFLRFYSLCGYHARTHAGIHTHTHPQSCCYYSTVCDVNVMWGTCLSLIHLYFYERHQRNACQNAKTIIKFKYDTHQKQKQWTIDKQTNEIPYEIVGISLRSIVCDICWEKLKRKRKR